MSEERAIPSILARNKHRKLSDLGRQVQRAIFYGPPKAGKTFGAGQFAKNYKLLWVDLEAGIQTLVAGLPPELQDNVYPIIVEDNATNTNAISTVLKLVTENKVHKICNAHGAIMCPKCVKGTTDDDFTYVNLFELDDSWIFVVDSMTQLASSAMQHALGATTNLEQLKKAEFDHYNKQQLLTENVAKGFRSLPCHTIVISHEEEIENEDKSKRVVPVGGTRNYSRTFARHFDHCVYFHARNRKHGVMTSSTADTLVLSGNRNFHEFKETEHLIELFNKAEPKEQNEKAKPGVGSLASKLRKP